MSLEDFHIDLNHKDPPDEFEAVLSRVKKLAAVAGAIGGVIGFGLSLAHWLLTDRPVSRGQIAMPFICGFGLSAMVTGAALLFAPPSFFNSETGREYMKAIGTRSVRSTKIVIAISLVIGCLLTLLLAAGALQMAGVL